MKNRLRCFVGLRVQRMDSLLKTLVMISSSPEHPAQTQLCPAWTGSRPGETPLPPSELRMGI